MPKSEKYWRKTIAQEIYDSCPEINNNNPYPCEDCYEFYEFVMSKVKTRQLSDFQVDTIDAMEVE